MTTVIGGFEGRGRRGAERLSTRPRHASSASARAVAAVRAQTAAQAERWPLWSPVAFGGGAAIYFGLPCEPVLWSVLGATALALAAAAAAWRHGRWRAASILAALLAFGALGFTVAAVKTRLFAAPVSAEHRRPVTVDAWVVDVASNTASKPRLLLAPAHVTGVAWRDTPVRVRMSLRPGAPLPGPGSAVRLVGVLGPPPAPSAPGSYDFARDAWFAQIGGSGLALKPAEAISLAPPPFGLRLEMAVNAGRWSLSRRIVDRMGAHRGGLATALVTGHQAWLEDGDVNAMRDSGLAHILSISGVHMAIVGGFVFALVRLLIAAWPWAALRVSGKKAAAAVGLGAIVGYLILSGAPPPAIRSALTAGIAFTAVLFDRRALSLHSLAVAALVVLVFQPESIVQPGFQMSFAATAALLALAESWPRRLHEISVPLPIRWAQRGWDWLVAGLAVSLVAGLATDPFAIQHFNRIVLWSLPANLLAEVLSSFVIMPALAVGAVLELAGLGGGPLWVAKGGLEALGLVARLFAGLPHAVMPWASAPGFVLPVSFVGLLVVCLWRGRLRWLGLPLFAVVWLWPRAAPPVAWIAGQGANVAVAKGRDAVLLRPRSQRFGFELWAHRRGYGFAADPDAATAASDALAECGRDSCTPKPGAPLGVAGWWRLKAPTADQLTALCAGARLVILRTGEGSCPGVRVVGHDALADGGAAEVFRRPDGSLRLSWAQDARGDRPWTAPAPEGDGGS